jgi:hypothetical protein
MATVWHTPCCCWWFPPGTKVTLKEKNLNQKGNESCLTKSIELEEILY